MAKKFKHLSKPLTVNLWEIIEVKMFVSLDSSGPNGKWNVIQMSSQKSGGMVSALGTECVSCIAPGLGWLPVDDDVSGFAEKPDGLGKRSSDGSG